jgi:hypothetical protein
MQAISRQNHRMLCRLIEEIRSTGSVQSNELAEMETELCNIFQNYQQRLDDLRELILAYDARKRAIRNTIRKVLREETVRRPHKI